MKSITLLFYCAFCLALNGFAQTVQKANGRLLFDQGKVFEISLQLKTTVAQQAMGQAIDFTVNATGDHQYKVTNATEENNTLHHDVSRIRFSFDGMGQKMNFDSNVEKDMKGQFGKPVKDVLDNEYDIIVDPGGTVLLAMPEKIVLSAADSRMAILTSMLKDIFDLVQPPKKGAASFFKVLPDKEVVKGDTWTISNPDNAAFIISDINDSTIVVDFVENFVTVTKAEMMGSEMTTTMNNKSTGKIILDKLTGIMKEKTFSTESNGNAETSFGVLPVTSKTNATITVKPVKASQ